MHYLYDNGQLKGCLWRGGFRKAQTIIRGPGVTSRYCVMPLWFDVNMNGLK
jgi:hypothetical protein